MLAQLRKLSKNLPTFLTALILAITVWIIAVTASDPTEDRLYPFTVPVEVIGQNAGLVITSDIPSSISLRLSAPQSVWNILNNQQASVRALVDLSGLEAGTHVVEVQIQISATPVKVISYSPNTITIRLENLASRVMQISLVTIGDPAVGYLAEDPVLETDQVTVTGPASQVNLVQEVRATLDINQAYDNINRTINLLVLDASENVIEDVNLSPERITVQQDINQRYGYRNVVVTVQVEGQVADGYRLTNTSVFPPLVTVFSSDPQVVNELPGYVNTVPLNLSGLKDDVDISLPLNLPDGVSVVDDRTSVLVRLSVAAVQSSLPLANVPVEVTGLSPLLSAKLSPQTVTIILSGPLPLLDAINYDDIRVVIDMTDYEVGTYQLEPVVELVPGEITVESIQPEVINIEVIVAPTPTPGLP